MRKSVIRALVFGIILSSSGFSMLVSGSVYTAVDNSIRNKRYSSSSSSSTSSWFNSKSSSSSSSSSKSSSSGSSTPETIYTNTTYYIYNNNQHQYRFYPSSGTTYYISSSDYLDMSVEDYNTGSYVTSQSGTTYMTFNTYYSPVLIRLTSHSSYSVSFSIYVY